MDKLRYKLKIPIENSLKKNRKINRKHFKWEEFFICMVEFGALVPHTKKDYLSPPIL